jgi:hypothetical protein
MTLAKLKLIFSSTVLFGYLLMGVVAFILFSTKSISDLEVILILSPYTAIAGAAKALFDNVAFNGYSDSIYGFKGKDLREFFTSLSEEIDNHFGHTTETNFNLNYIITAGDFRLLVKEIQELFEGHECVDPGAFVKAFTALFHEVATVSAEHFLTEPQLWFYVRKIGTWLDQNRTFEAETKIPRAGSVSIILVSAAYPLSGIVLLLCSAFSLKDISPSDIGLISGLVSGLFASYWSGTTQKLFGLE